MKVPDEDIINIAEMANCGKMELEVSARAFIEKHDDKTVKKANKYLERMRNILNRREPRV